MKTIKQGGVMKAKFTMITVILSVAVIYCFGQQKLSIEDIINNPGPYVEEKVEIEGIIEQFTPETSTTNAHYLLKGKYGGIIKVKTDESEPIQNQKYRVVGTVYIEDFRPFIHERFKVCLDCPPPISSEDQIIEKTDYTLYIILGAGVILLALITVFLVIQSNRKRKLMEQAVLEEEERKKQAEQEKKEDTKPEERQEFSTIKLSRTDPKTMKFIPGKLEIQSFEDKGKSFKITGFPTPEGFIVTIGRKSVIGERAYAHISIDEKFKTVSRMQAELIYREGKLYVKSIGETNLTQVDGYEIPIGDIVEFKPGSLLKIGELDFKYIV